MTRPLNPQQQAVVDWVRNGRGSLNLIARAGTGKTFTLIEGVVRAVVEGNLGEVALMAYNKSAGEEFKARLAALAERTGDRRFLEWKRVQAGTVHSFGFSMVRKWSPGVKVDDGKVPAICDELSRGNAESVYAWGKSAICQLVSLGKQSAFGFRTPATDLRAWFDLAEHHAVNDLAEGRQLDDVVRASVQVLQESVRRDRDVIDFDDMVLAPLVHNLRAWPKDWVLLDEAQDTNAARRALALKMLRPKTGRLVAVGDDRQAIYGFTGADSDALELIALEVGSSVLPLTVTYRCPKSVVREAQRLVPDLVAHETAPDGNVRSLAATKNVQTVEPNQMPSGPDEAMSVDFKPQHQSRWFEDERPLPTDAVLCRNTKPLVEEAYAMLAAGIGCRVEGREIGEGLVKLATRWKRVTTLGALADKLAEYRDREVQKWLAKGREDRAQAAEDKVDTLRAVMVHLEKDGKTAVEDLVEWVRNLFGDTRPGEAPNVVTLSTIHKAKGREWDRVYLLHRDRTLPSPYARKPWQQRQEANLEYVAITRAKKELIYVN